VPAGGKLVRARELAAAHPDCAEHGSASAPDVPRFKRIVLIDDYEGIHDSFRVALDGVPVELISAYTGDLGVEAVRACHPDLVFLDLKMPRRDGVSTLREIRERDTHTPIIVMTAFAEEFTSPLESADRDGAYFELLAKPLDIDEIHLVSAVATGGFGRTRAAAATARPSSSPPARSASTA
jgi:DNA-binding NtrC family response regulator